MNLAGCGMPDVPLLTRAARIAAVVLIIAFLTAVPASAGPTNPLCDSGTYRRAHPLICDTGWPMPNLGGGGGGIEGGGLIGIIGRVLGGLTGGLL
jgi:hypothetical protein